MVPAKFCGPAQKLTEGDISVSAAMMGVDKAAIKAVLEVEARGTGFHRSGAPVILYEPHIAYRETKGTERKKLERKGLAYKRWGARRYPKTTAERYGQLDAAITICGDKAYRWASYGLPQMMGFNHKVCGYDTAEEMFEDFKQSEGNQLGAMMKFIRANKRMHQAMKNLDWATFARAYNGPGYKKNRYDKKLAAAYARHKSRNPLKSKKPRPENKSWLTVGDKGEAVKALQRDLIKLGVERVKADGDYGPLTKQAVQVIQRRLGLKADGIAGAKTLAAIKKALR